MLDIFEMIILAFLVIDKANCVRFFEETFLVANISLEVVLGMPFLILSDVDGNFLRWEFWWRTFTTEVALLTTRHTKLVGKKEFAAAVLDLK